MTIDSLNACKLLPFTLDDVTEPQNFTKRLEGGGDNAHALRCRRLEHSRGYGTPSVSQIGLDSQLESVRNLLRAAAHSDCGAETLVVACVLRETAIRNALAPTSYLDIAPAIRNSNIAPRQIAELKILHRGRFQ